MEETGVEEMNPGHQNPVSISIYSCATSYKTNLEFHEKKVHKFKYNVILNHKINNVNYSKQY